MGTTLMMVSLVSLFYLFSSISAQQATYSAELSSGLQGILSNANNNSAYRYPTDFTRGIIPKGIHSHNDYWRPVPFYSALSVGCISIEVDIYYINGTLYVGHEPAALTPSRTFDSLYIQPILDTLRRTNPITAFYNGSSATLKNGVYDFNWFQTLYLFVDIKSNGTAAWPAVVAALQPLRSAGFLTTYFGSTLVAPGAVTVVGTGGTPLSNFTDDSTARRDYFYDANLSQLNGTQANITRFISPVASTSFSSVVGSVTNTTLNSTQLQRIRGQLAVAREKGILARYYDLPAWPISYRNSIWQTLVAEGVGLLSVDEIVEAAGVGSAGGYW